MFEQGRSILRRWFDSVEVQLAVEAERAGIFKHPSITGNARENVVRKVLQELLPSNVSLSSGRIIGADSEPSKQIDIVVFDGRYPVLRMGEDSLFPVEGVIAAIEVKSELNEQELGRALLNAASVMAISPSFVKEDADAWVQKQTAAGLSSDEAWDALVWNLIPRTYVFAFNGLVSRDALSSALGNRLKEYFPRTASRPMMPSVIVSGGAVTVALGNSFVVKTKDAHLQEQIDKLGVAITFESSNRFGILASHLLWHLENRTTMLEKPDSIRRSIQTYLPFSEYINECIFEKQFAVTLWHERLAPRRISGGAAEI